MACYHPLKGFPIGTTKTGKTEYMITGYYADHVEKVSNGGEKSDWQVAHDSFVSPGALRSVSDFVQIPCGECIGCRLDYSRDWANRCMLELGYHDHSAFVTLTYDDAHIPYSTVTDPDTGEIAFNQTLNKRDFQLFMKRLRKNYHNRFPDRPELRFYACGEYGSQTYRPHYHAIIYGLALDDLQFYRCTPNGDILYTSEFLSDCWQHQGYVVVGEVTWESCAYVARYIMKKLKGQFAEFYETTNITPEFTLMSRRPGIARQYYDDHPDLYEYDNLFISMSDGGREIRPPRYYDRLYDVDYPDHMAAIKENRKKFAEEQTKIKLSKCSYSYLEMLQVEEDHKKAQIKSLRRSL